MIGIEIAMLLFANVFVLKTLINSIFKLVSGNKLFMFLLPKQN